MDNKKPTFWIVAAAMLLCIILTGCLTANPLNDSSESQPQAEYKNQDDYLKAIDDVEGSTEPLSLADYIGKWETVDLFEDSGGEIMGHKFNIPHTDMTDLYAVLGTDSSALPESMIVRSVAFFRGLYLDQQELLTLLSTDTMISNLDKTALAIKPVKAEWPQTVRMPEIINNSRFSVKMEEHGYIATAELVISADGFPLIDGFSIAYNANLNKLDDIDMAILRAMGCSDEVIAGFSAEQLAEKLAPGSIDDGDVPFRPDETQSRALSAEGLAFEYDILILGKLGYTYADMIALTDKEYNFIFPNTQLIQKLIDKGYEYDIIRNKNTLHENGYDSYKELIKEALAN